MKGGVVAVVVIALVAAMGMVAVASPASESTGANDVTPGEEVAGAVLYGEAEIEADVQVRAHGHDLREAETPEDRAHVIAEQVAADEARLSELEDRLAELNDRHESGELSTGQYRAKVAVTAVQIAAIERNTQQSAAYAPELSDHLAERGVSLENIEKLRNDANELSGQEVAEIAREIAGGEPDNIPADVTPGLDDDVPANVTIGPPDESND